MGLCWSEVEEIKLHKNRLSDEKVAHYYKLLDDYKKLKEQNAQDDEIYFNGIREKMSTVSLQSKMR